MNNRSFKFRVWNTKLKRFVSNLEIGELTTEVNKGLIGTKWESKENDPQTQLAADCVIQQFTGLQDKNGKEIFEGDIVKKYSETVGDWLLEIVFKQGTFGFVFLKEELPYQLLQPKQSMEIIGNIFQNPDLLK